MNTLAAYFLSLIAALLISLFLFKIGVSMQVQALNAGLSSAGSVVALRSRSVG